MKKRLLLLIMLSAAGSAFALLPPPQSEIACPVGGEEFWATMHDSAPEYQICPGNKLVFKTAKYGKFTKQELARYEKIINSKAYRSLPAHAENAHRIAAFAELSGEYSPAAVGWLYFCAANGKYPGEPYSRAELKRLHRKALSHLNKALREPGSPQDKQSARYALAGIYRISGDFTRAESVLRTLLQDNLDPNDRKDAEYVLESVRLKDSGHILPRFHRPAMP